jgi:hypothetical protein
VALAVKYLQRRPRTFIKEMLPRIDRREVIRQDEDGEEWICQKGEEVLQMAGVLTTEEYVHSEEARDFPEIHTNEEYIWEVQKLPK